TPVVVSPGLTLTDLSSTSGTSATVSITGGFHAGEDVLAFRSDGATMGNIAASYDVNTGVMTLSATGGGTATLAQWQAALASVTYTDTAVTPANAARTVSFTVTDGNGTTSDVQTRSVSVTDTDQTPIVTTAGSASFTARGNGSTPAVVAPQV